MKPMKKKSMVTRVLIVASAALALSCSPALAKTTIKVWSMFKPETVGWDKVFKAFEKNHPGIKVQYSSIGWGPEKYLAACAGGSAPDITVISDEFINFYAGKNLLSPAPRDIQAELEAKFYPATVSMCKYKGKTWGLPVEFSFMALQYNKTLFKERGLVPEAPVTWNEMALAAQKLAIWEGAKLKRAGMNMWANGGTNEIFPTFQCLLASNGASDIPDDLKNLKLTTDPLSMETLEYMVDMVQKYRADAVDAKLDPWSGFTSGKLPMWIEGTWATSQANVKNKDIWNAIDIAPVPKGKGPSSSYGWGWVAGVSRGSKNQAASWELIKFLTNEDNGRLYADLLGTAIPRKGVESSIKDHLRVKYDSIAQTVRTRPVYNKFYLQIRELAGTLFQKAIIGRNSPEDAMGQFEKQLRIFEKQLK